MWGTGTRNEPEPTTSSMLLRASSRQPKQRREDTNVGIRFNSLTAYNKAVLDGVTGDVRRKILLFLLNAELPMTRRMIEVSTGIRISTVTPAVLSLLEDKRIFVTHSGLDPHSGHRADFLMAVVPQPEFRDMEWAPKQQTMFPPTGTYSQAYANAVR